MVAKWNIDDADRTLLRVIDTDLAAGERRAGRHMACKLGCTECCIGPFPISQLDARRLRRGLAILAARDPVAAARVRERARKAVRQMAPGFPGDAARGLLAPDEAREEEFCTWHADLACPALNPVSGACDLYEWRPVACHTFGLPVRFGPDPLPPCHLCFQGAEEAEIESCSVDVDPDGIEDAILAKMELEGAPEAQTLVAWAILDRSDP